MCQSVRVFSLLIVDDNVQSLWHINLKIAHNSTEGGELHSLDLFWGGGILNFSKLFVDLFYVWYYYFVIGDIRVFFKSLLPNILY